MSDKTRFFAFLFSALIMAAATSCSLSANDDSGSVSIYLPQVPEAASASSRSISVPQGASVYPGITQFVVILREKDNTAKDDNVFPDVAPGSTLVIDNISSGEHSIAIATSYKDESTGEWTHQYYGRTNFFVKGGQKNQVAVNLKRAGTRTCTINFTSASACYNRDNLWIEVVMYDVPARYEGFEHKEKQYDLRSNSNTITFANSALFWEPGVEYKAILRVYECDTSGGDRRPGALIETKSVPFKSSPNVAAAETLTINVP